MHSRLAPPALRELCCEHNFARAVLNHTFSSRLRRQRLRNVFRFSCFSLLIRMACDAKWLVSTYAASMTSLQRRQKKSLNELWLLHVSGTKQEEVPLAD